MIENAPAWLYHDVPLWVFMLALLTSPAEWSRRALRVMKRASPWGGTGDE
jgi:hypothetical protein